MNLLIDTGNTRIKWALADGPSLVTRGVVEHADV
ncbi:MAG: type III pantothenate kinase, partial [Betaproteobacteria bacterium]|nr:type III pantothenate kinase [Betaproteobacteria bacterium]